MPPPKDPIKYKKYCKLLSELGKKRMSDPAVRQKIRENTIKQFSVPGAREKASKAQIKRWENQEEREKYRECRLGEKGINYKGGKNKDSNGYVLILLPEHHLSGKMGYVAEHRLVAEQCLGRLLSKTEVIHHINGIKDDNRPENLYLFPNRSEHMRFHRSPYFIISNII